MGLEKMHCAPAGKGEIVSQPKGEFFAAIPECRTADSGSRGE